MNTVKSSSDIPATPNRNLDRWTHSQLSNLTGGISNAALHMAFDDWLVHLSHNPAQQAELAALWFKAIQQLASYGPSSLGVTSMVPPLESLQDRRFADASWQSWPFNFMSQSFLQIQQWWRAATTDIHGVSKHHEDVVSFTIKQMLDMFSPANFVWSNPEVIKKTLQSGGLNLWHGAQNLAEDEQRARLQAPPLGVDAFQVGKNVAVTPGKVVLRNQLIELIQYAPTSDKVQAEPILIVPAWIMKYYILDLSPGNSLIKYLVDHGHTVFAVSWVNPGATERDLGMDDYLQLGIMAALDAVNQIVPEQKVHGVGYCLGGTLFSIAAAAMGRKDDQRLASLSMFAAQTDFTEPGELSLFIDDSQISLLEDIMWDKGYLESKQMAGAFELINANKLIWSRMLKDYLLGERTAMSDLMAWNADGTRLPYRMHSEYLRRLYLHNDLASGRYTVRDQHIALSDIQCPIFCLGTQRDHVAPWHSVFKLHMLTDVDLTFVLTSGGHNVGIVNPPGVAGRSYQALTRQHDGHYLDPDSWVEAAPQHEGSWWPYWQTWLQSRSGERLPPPPMGDTEHGLAPLCDAPGTYVLQK